MFVLPTVCGIQYSRVYCSIAFFSIWMWFRARGVESGARPKPLSSYRHDNIVVS